MYKRNKIIILVCLLSTVVFTQEQQPVKDSLEVGFKNPPNQAKARTWWHWISGHVSKSGITKDLEAMKKVGIQEAQLFNVHLGFPKGSVKYLSEEWLNLFKFSAEEAKRLDLELGFHNSPGWSSSGGPWVTEEQAMQTVVFSELTIEGGKRIKTALPKPKTKFDYYKDIVVLAFPKPKETKKINGLDFKILSERIRNHLLPDTKTIPQAAVIAKETVIDITAKVSTAGVLEWDAPQGEWIILRFGHTPIGTTNRPAPPEAKGLEVDKMSKKAVDAYWKNGVQPIIDKLGDLIGSTVNNCLIDSYEVGTTNWTTGFESQFEKLRGYDLTAYLPTLAGYYVESGEISERFLWDFRRTIGDLIAKNYYAHFRELCHKNGMQFSVEPYWGPFDNMQVGATGDIVMCEFWSGGYPFFDSPKFVSSIAHLNGSSIVGAESFTGIGGWQQHPATIKSIGDRAWTEGITRFIFHTYVHQPWDVGPGLSLSYHGTEFDRLNTWWNQGKVFMDYVGRSQFLLQQGKNVADVLVFTGESSPNTAFLKPEIKKLGFDYDLIGANKLKDLSVKKGTIYSAVGNTYKVLVLPNSDFVKPETLEKIKELVAGGAKVIGQKPSQSPSLSNYPTCDVMVKRYADELWTTCLVEDISIVDFLKKEKPDFKIEKGNPADISYIHRKTDKADIYFIANSKKESRTEVCNFRISGKQAELWNAETGEIRDLVVWQNKEDGTTSIPIHFESEEAVFVVLKKQIKNLEHIVATTTELKKPKPEALSNLKIIKAEYGTFLQEGLVDVTQLVANEVKDNKLNIQATRHFCDCDPAMGYKKEFRLEYQIGTSIHQIFVMELEHINIDASNKGELKILKAVFGKFKPETKGVPEYYPTYDVTKKIKDKIAADIFEVSVDNSLIDGKSVEGNQPVLRVTYSTDGEEYTLSIPTGQKLNLSKAHLKSALVFEKGKVNWETPYAGKITYSTSTGKTKTVQVESVPEPIELKGSWKVTFPHILGSPKNATFNKLDSWSNSPDKEIRYFSGTATYRKQFELSEKLIQSETALALDLASVRVIAEVSVNGKNVGTLWKAPFRIKIDDFVTKGSNTLEVKITNLWANRLIGDEHFPLDFERKGKKIKRLPDWLLNQTKRPSERTTFSSFKHWDKEDALQMSGLLGPVKIIIFKKVNLQK